jgi:hypothetical protein
MPKRPIAVIVPRIEQRSIRRETTMNPNLMAEDELLEEGAGEEMLIHAWRTEQLERLGLPRVLAERLAERVDWHELANLIGRGCTLELALEIAR